MAPTTAKPTPNPERRKVARDGLLAALERLVQQGASIAEISVERLISEAGISRWRFYNYFADKSDLLLACFEEIRRELEQVGAILWDLDTAPTRAELRRVLRSIAAAYTPHATLLDAMNDTRAYDKPTRDALDAMERTRIDRWQAHIARGQHGGWIKPHLLAAETATLIEYTGVRGFEQLAAHATDPESALNDFADAFAQYVWFVLYDRAAPCDAAAVTGS